MTRTVTSGSTLAVASGTTERVDAEVNNGGTVANAGTVALTGGLSQVNATDAVATVEPASTSKRFGRRQIAVVAESETVTPATGRVSRQTPAVAATAVADAVIARSRIRRALTGRHSSDET